MQELAHFNGVEFLDTTVRLVNLEAGQLDMVERLGPTDAATVRKNPKLRLVGQTALAYYSISINLANKGPLTNPLVREALQTGRPRNASRHRVLA